ncbi:hypothetical protein IKZ77_03450 [Candidatus Saccharibacteria bacterium]|nr:hypothetical protein [Candidatus Saccharibacteria bacterium]
MKERIITGIKKELENLSSEKSKDFYYALDQYTDDYDNNSIRALIFKWDQLGYGDFDNTFPVTAKLVTELKSIYDGIERSREVYEDIISLAKNALEEIKEYKIA